MLVGKRHPTFHHLVRELQKEQRGKEGMITELSLGRRSKAPRIKKYIRADQQLQRIATDCPTYKDEGRVLDY